MSFGELNHTLQSIIQASPVATVALAADGQVVACNAPATSLFQLCDRSPLPSHWKQGLILPESWPAFARWLEQAYQSPTAIDGLVVHTPGPSERAASHSCRVSAATLSQEFAPGTLLLYFELTNGTPHDPALPNGSLVKNVVQQALLKAATTDRPEDLLRISLEAVCMLTGWEAGNAWLVEPGDSELRPLEFWSADDPDWLAPLKEAIAHARLQPGSGLAGLVWQARRAEWSNDLGEITEPINFAPAIEKGLSGVFALPVFDRNQVAAVLEFYSGEPVRPDPQFLLSVTTLANEMGRAIERRRWDADRRRLAAIVSSTPDAVISFSKSGEIRSWNEGARRMYGYTEEEALGKTYSLICAVPSREEQSAIRSVLLGVRVTHLQCKRRSRRGTELEVLVTMSPVRDAAGEIDGYASIEHDITALRRIQKERDQREAEMRLLLNSTGEAIYGVDLQGNCTFANAACARVLGFPDTESLLGHNMHDLVQHADQYGQPCPAEDCVVAQSVLTGESGHSDHQQFIRQDGARLPVEIWSYPVVGDGVIRGAVVVFEDITARQVRQQERARLAAIVDSSYDAIIGRSLDGAVTSWNHGAELVYGYTSEEAIGQKAAMLLPEGDSEEEELRMAEQSGQRLEQFETVRRRKDGTSINVSITLSPLFDQAGELIGTSSIERDVTQRIREEQELRAARDQAEAASRAKSEFVANISHELRTPMNAIIGMLELSLQDVQLSDLLRDYLSTAADSSHLMLALVNDLLDFSRMEAGKFELDEQPFSIREVVNETMHALALRANESGLELACHFDASVPDNLTGDPRRLRQILMNLVGNAIKFTLQGEVSVWVRALDQWDDQVRLQVSVSDTGIGIAPENLDRIFQPFTQVDASSTRPFAGAGLGLTICRQLVEQMGGKVTLDSQVGEGTTIHCTPVFTISANQEALDDPLLLRQLRGQPVLIVDDNQTNRRILEETLGSWNMRITSAEDGESALELLQEARQEGRPYALALVDAMMPEIDGIGLIREMNARKLAPDTVVVMLSSADRQSLQNACRELGVADVLEKPVARKDLLRSLARQLGAAVDSTEPGTADAGAAPTPLRILVAEDTVANQKVVCAILAARGHHAQAVRDGQEAVDAVRQSSFDLVLMDVQMPNMDGFEATRAIRALDDSQRSSLPIIALTAHAMKGDRQQCLDAGMDGYLAKPINASRLIMMVERLAGANRWASRHHHRPVQAESSAMDATPQSTSESVIHLDRALERLGNDESLLRDMAGFYLEDVPPLMEDIERGLKEGDAELVTRSAHSIKGLSANFDASHAITIAQSIEESGRRGNLDEAASSISALRAQTTLVMNALKTQFFE